MREGEGGIESGTTTTLTWEGWTLKGGLNATRLLRALPDRVRLLDVGEVSWEEADFRGGVRCGVCWIVVNAGVEGIAPFEVLWAGDMLARIAACSIVSCEYSGVLSRSRREAVRERAKSQRRKTRQLMTSPVEPTLSQRHNWFERSQLLCRQCRIIVAFSSVFCAPDGCRLLSRVCKARPRTCRRRTGRALWNRRNRRGHLFLFRSSETGSSCVDDGGRGDESIRGGGADVSRRVQGGRRRRGPALVFGVNELSLFGGRLRSAGKRKEITNEPLSCHILPFKTHVSSSSKCAGISQVGWTCAMCLRR